ncbi:MAG: hypothetical protein AAGE86_01105 [Pseudomonadota bacterium]
MAGCAVQSPPVLTSSVGQAPSAIARIHLIEPDAEQAQRGALFAAMVQELRGRGVELSEDADAVADIAISVSPSPVGLYASEAGKSDEEPEALATTRKRRWYDACEAVRVQATLVVYNRADGALRKSSKAESMDCDDGEPPIAELAALLADDLLSD